MAVSKVVFGNNTIMDITDSTITADKVLEGEIAYAADGSRIVGTASGGGSDDALLECGMVQTVGGKEVVLPLSNYVSAGYQYDHDPVISIGQAWYRNATFNTPFRIGKYVTFISSLLSQANAFNNPLYIPENVRISESVFAAHPYYNNNVTFDANLKAQVFTSMFYNCPLFNRPLIFPKNTMSLARTIELCKGFNQPILLLTKDTDQLPYIHAAAATVNNTGLNFLRMLNASSNFQSNIIFASPNAFVNKNESRIAFSQMLNGTGTGKKCIYTYNPAIFANSSRSATQTITGSAITWTATTNGYYNATSNIYIYNNVSDALNWFNSYWHDLYGEYPDYEV